MRVPRQIHLMMHQSHQMLKELQKLSHIVNHIEFEMLQMIKLPDVVGAFVPNPPKFAPPSPVGADDVIVLKPPNAGADVAAVGAPKPLSNLKN